MKNMEASTFSGGEEVKLTNDIQSRVELHRGTIKDGFYHLPMISVVTGRPTFHESCVGSQLSEGFMAQPIGFVAPDHSTHVCRIHRSLYGLKQASRAWFRRLSDFLLKNGFVASCTDTSLFILQKSILVVYFLVNINDIIVASNRPIVVNDLLSRLRVVFLVKDFGFPSFFLGVKVRHSSVGLHLSQLKYTLDILRSLEFDGSKPYSTPMSLTTMILRGDGPPFRDPTLFRKIMGSH